MSRLLNDVYTVYFKIIAQALPNWGIFNKEKEQILVDSFYGNAVNRFYTLFLFSFRLVFMSMRNALMYLSIGILFVSIHSLFPLLVKDLILFFLPSACEQLWLLVRVGCLILTSDVIKIT